MRSTCTGDLRPPTYQYATAPGGSAIIGGSVYRGSTIPALRGRYFFADSGTGRVWSAAYDQDSNKLIDVIEHTQQLVSEVFTSIENDNRGELYLTSRQDNALYRLAPSP